MITRGMRLEQIVVVRRETRVLARLDLELWLRRVLEGEAAVESDAAVRDGDAGLATAEEALPACAFWVGAVRDPGKHVELRSCVSLLYRVSRRLEAIESVRRCARARRRPSTAEVRVSEGKKDSSSPAGTHQEVVRDLLALLQHLKQLLKRLDDETANRANTRRLASNLVLDVASKFRINRPCIRLLLQLGALVHLVQPPRQVKEQVTKPLRVSQTEQMGVVEFVVELFAEGRDCRCHGGENARLAVGADWRREGRELLGGKVRDSHERRFRKAGLAKEGVVLPFVD